jgi:phage shock protein E
VVFSRERTILQLEFIAMKHFFYFCTLLFVTACSGSESKNTAFKDLPVAEFKEQLAKEGGTLIDVRTVEEFQEGHIEGALQYDYYENESFEAALAALDKEKTYFIYCRSGGRSGTTLDMMQQMGFKKVYNLDGGMLAWRKAGEAVAMP